MLYGEQTKLLEESDSQKQPRASTFSIVRTQKSDFVRREGRERASYQMFFRPRSVCGNLLKCIHNNKRRAPRNCQTFFPRCCCGRGPTYVGNGGGRSMKKERVRFGEGRRGTKVWEKEVGVAAFSGEGGGGKTFILVSALSILSRRRRQMRGQRIGKRTGDDGTATAKKVARPPLRFSDVCFFADENRTRLFRCVSVQKKLLETIVAVSERGNCSFAMIEQDKWTNAIAENIFFFFVFPRFFQVWCIAGAWTCSPPCTRLLDCLARTTRSSSRACRTPPPDRWGTPG